MKILIATGIYPPEIGGPASYVYAVARTLRDLGHRVSIVAYGDAIDTNEDDTIPVHRVSRQGGAVLRYVRMMWRLLRESRDADVLYAQDAVSSGVPASVANLFLGKRLVVRIPGDYAWEIAQQRGEQESLDTFLTHRHRGLVRILEWLERFTVRRADRLITPSKYLYKVVETWGAQARRISVVVNAADPLPITGSYDEERAQLGIRTAEMICLTVVRAVPWKGVAELIEWWKDIPDTHRLVIAGDGPELERWKALANQAALFDRIVFLGRSDRATLARWYAAADIFLLHSGYEGYPFVVAEAASVGLPCCVSDRGGNTETLENYPEKITVLPYQNKAAWVEAIARTRARPQARPGVFSPSVRTYQDMIHETVAALDAPGGSVDPSDIFMVSYDRELLNPTSDVFARVHAQVGEQSRLHVFVIAALPKDGTVMQGSMRVSGWRGSAMRRLWMAYRAMRASRRMHTGAAVVTAQDPFAAGWVGYLFSRLSRLPLEVQEHGDFYSGYWVQEGFKNQLLAFFGRWILRRAERVRVVSERVRDHVRGLGVSESKISVLSVAQELSSLLSRPFPRLGAVPHIVAPCRFVEQKGLDVLIQAAALLRDHRVSFRLSLIGSGPLETALKEDVARLKLDAQVRFEPWRSPGVLWDGAEIFVLASRYEGWGRTVVEAMASGVPVVATETGCVGSFFRPDIDGLTVPMNEPKALAQAIELLITDSQRREQMAHAARDRARTYPTASVLQSWQRASWRLASSRAPRFFHAEVWSLLLIFWIVAARVASAWLFHGTLSSREWGFFTLVDHFRQGFGYSFASEVGCVSAYRAPAYLFFLTGLYAIFSPANTFAQALVQNAVAAIGLWLVYVIGRRLVGRSAAWIAAFLMAVYPYTFYHFSQYYHTFLSVTLLLLLVWTLLRLDESRRLVFAIAAGVSTAALAYVQGTILLAMPFIALWLVCSWRPQIKRALMAIAIIAGVSVALIAPWTLRNMRALHAFVPLTTDLGFGFFKANNENIYALTERGYPQEVVDEVEVSSTNPDWMRYRLRPSIAAELAADGQLKDSLFWTEWHPKEIGRAQETCAALGPMDEPASHRYWLAKGRDWFISQYLVEGWKLQLLKLKTFWQPALFPSVKMGAMWSFADDARTVWAARTATTVASAFVILFGWIGLLCAFIRRDRRAWLPLIILLVYTVMHTLFAGYTKYRIPLDFLLAPYAVWTLLALWRIRYPRTPSTDL